MQILSNSRPNLDVDQEFEINVKASTFVSTNDLSLENKQQNDSLINKCFVNFEHDDNDRLPVLKQIV